MRSTRRVKFDKNATISLTVRNEKRDQLQESLLGPYYNVQNENKRASSLKEENKSS